MVKLETYVKMRKMHLSLLFIGSFIFLLYALSRYLLSYGIDGAFYDIQMRNIANSGFPDTNDPPLVYYYMYFFYLVFGEFTGIKVAMAVIGALTVIPSYQISINLLKERSDLAHELSLLSGLLMVFNSFALRMIEDFMQNYFGVLFLLSLIYTISQLPSKKYLIFSFIFLGLAFLSHIYIAGLSLIIFTTGIIIHMRKGTSREEKIYLVLGVIGIIFILLIISLFIPSTLNFSKIWSFLQDLIARDRGNFFSLFSYINIPFILGVYIMLKKMSGENLQVLLLVLSLTIIFLSSPIIPMTWSSRFMMLAFVVIALISPHSLLLVSNKRWKVGLIVLVAIVSIISANLYIGQMGPTITQEQYEELYLIRNSGIIPVNAVIVNGVYEQAYWMEYIFSNEIVSENVDNGYIIISTNSVDTPFNVRTDFSSSLFFPYQLNLDFSPPGSSQPLQPTRSGPQQPAESIPQQPTTSLTIVGDLLYDGEYYQVIHQ